MFVFISYHYAAVKFNRRQSGFEKVMRFCIKGKLPGGSSSLFKVSPCFDRPVKEAPEALEGDILKRVVLVDYHSNPV